MAQKINICGGIIITSKRKITYSTSETVGLTGATIKQIYYWEKRGFLNPDKVVCGKIAYKRYTPSQVEIVKGIKGYLDQGYTLAKAAELALDGK